MNDLSFLPPMTKPAILSPTLKGVVTFEPISSTMPE
jgi:hypothetical protein